MNHESQKLYIGLLVLYVDMLTNFFARFDKLVTLVFVSDSFIVKINAIIWGCIVQKIVELLQEANCCSSIKNQCISVYALCLTSSKYGVRDVQPCVFRSCLQNLTVS